MSTGAMAQIKYVSVAAPVPEMSLFGCADGMLGSSTYDRTSYLDAWKTTIQAMQSSFTGVTKLLPVPVSQVCKPDDDGRAFYHDALNYALGLNTSGFENTAALVTSSTLTAVCPIACNTRLGGASGRNSD